ncbi:MAG TPA: hydroxymethylbilane synthase [Pirellulales bacterium]|jgi:hydroxymethylbilane synthase|nr:hydroxymethylbilane synthase [Pirellulales bacterium]
MADLLKIRIGTRASPLARWQADWVAAELRRYAVEVELVSINTRGDQQQAGPIGEIGGGQGVFTKEIQRALLDGRIDLAVHSLKDLPTDVVPGLVLAAVPPRESCGDVLVSREQIPFAQLPLHSLIGTGSLRRRAHLLHARPDLQLADVRGNVDTRLRKLADGSYDALVLAEAGLKRLLLTAAITEVLPKSLLLPAVGQGALGLETREDEPAIRAAVGRLDHEASRQAVLAERAMLAALRGGCLAPIGAYGRIEADGELHLSGNVLSPDGRQRLSAERSGPASLAGALKLGNLLAQELLVQGAAELIDASRAK